MKFQKNLTIKNPKYINTIEVYFDNGEYSLTFNLTKDAYYVPIGTDGYVDKAAKATQQDSKYMRMQDVFMINRHRLSSEHNCACSDKEKLLTTIKYIAQYEPKDEMTDIINEIDAFVRVSEKTFEITSNLEKFLKDNLTSMQSLTSAESVLHSIDASVKEQTTKTKEQRNDTFKTLVTSHAPIFNKTKATEERSEPLSVTTTAPGLISTPASQQE